MGPFIRFGVQNPVVANLIVLVILVAGVLFGLDLRREFFPEVRPNRVLISAPYPGASPDEIEESLVLKIEDALGNINEVVEIDTTITTGLASFNVEFEEGMVIEDAVADVKREIDALEDLPEQSERIIVRELEPNLPAIAMALVGDRDELVMKETIRQIRDDLESLDGMGDVRAEGTRPSEVTIEVRPEALLEHSISLTDVAASVSQAMAEVPGGSVRTGTSNVSIRTIGAEEQAEEVRGIVVKASADGTIIRIEDIARVTNGFADVDVQARVNGARTVSVTAYKVGDQDAILISKMLRAYAAGRTRQPLELGWFDRIKAQLGGSPITQAYDLGVKRPAIAPDELIINTDLSRFISGRLDLLRRNALWGGLLVFATLLLLLNTRVALWVTVGLIISIFGTLAFMSLFGITLNLLTMFGLIIVIGLLVDDGIVVAENITARHEAGDLPKEAARRGATMVAWPVVATILTSIFAFSALALAEGQIGDMMAVLPKVVVVALGVSLIEALFILPSHMAHSLERSEERLARNGRSEGKIGAKLEAARTHLFQVILIPRYEVALRWCLERRYMSLSIAVAILIASLGMIAGGRLDFTFLGEQDAESVMVDLRMPIGTPINETDRAIKRIEAAALADNVPEVSLAFAVAGSRASSDGTESLAQPHVGQVWLELVRAEDRTRTSEEVIQTIRDNLGTLDGMKSLRIEAMSGGPEGPSFTYTVTSDNPYRIAPVVREVKSMLSSIDGVYDITDDSDAGQRELRFSLRPGARELGFTTRTVAEQVRGWVYGLEAHTFAAPDEDVDVRVIFDEETRRSIAGLESQHVFTPDGRAVPLSEVAVIEETRSYATIRRLDRNRTVSVTAEARNEINPEAISRQLAPRLAQLEREHPGVKILARGRQQEVAESLGAIPLGIMVAVSLIYVTLAWLFGSYTQPAIVLLAIPFGLIGMVWGHLAMGYDYFTFLSLIGFIALTGVIVNDALIFIEFYNHSRAAGTSVFEAAVHAGRGRFRAIILTTTTTVLGLSPLMAEPSFQAKFLIPMAITISFGLIAATFIVLLITPCLLLISHDAHRVLYWLWHGEQLPEPEDEDGPPKAPPPTTVEPLTS